MLAYFMSRIRIQTLLLFWPLELWNHQDLKLKRMNSREWLLFDCIKTPVDWVSRFPSKWITSMKSIKCDEVDFVSRGLFFSPNLLQREEVLDSFAYQNSVSLIGNSCPTNGRTSSRSFSKDKKQNKIHFIFFLGGGNCFFLSCRNGTLFLTNFPFFSNSEE